MVRAVDFAVPLRSYSFLPLLDKRFSAHFPYQGSKLAIKPVPCFGAIDERAWVLILAREFTTARYEYSFAMTVRQLA
jgi:hypothetical protein